MVFYTRFIDFGGNLLIVKSLSLNNYRNYSSVNLEFSESINVFYGNNGQGKTNLIEAIYFCSSGRSHRTSKDTELIKIGSQKTYIGLLTKNSERYNKIEIQIDRNERKRIKLNEIPAKKVGELMGRLNAVIFCPEDLLLVKEGPSERRRFVDIGISQARPSYFYDLQQYLKVLSQKNNLLREIQSNNRLKDTLEVWNTSLAEYGSKIIKCRQDFLNRISILATKKHSEFTNDNERLNIIYKPSIKIDNGDNIITIKEKFGKQLNDVFFKEITKGVSLIGVQRDDFDITLNEIDLKHFGSQGQQRTAVLAMKAAEVEIIKEQTNELPILLLDDVMSELDTTRQKLLFNSLSGIQTFITCTDGDLFRNLDFSDINFFNVIDGIVIEKK